MNKFQPKTLAYILIFIIFLAFTSFFVSNRTTEAPTKTPIVAEKEPEVVPVTPVATDDIVINSPLTGNTLSSGTLKVSGKARGTWYFEASAPFEIQDSNKNVIAQKYVTAQGEWMTTEFVPFEGEITFTVPAGVTSGYVVFRNDNPSGEPSRDKSVVVPVKFK